MEEIDWNMASNSQMKEELQRLKDEFNKKQDEMKNLVAQMDVLHIELDNISKNYVEITKILNKREGKGSNVVDK